MPPPSSSISALAICLRCQFRYSHRLLRLRRPFTTTSRRGAVTFPETQLLVLESLAPRVSRHKFGIPEQPLEELAVEALEGRSKELLTYEDVAAMDTTGIDISLRRPSTLRVSKERFEQLGGELGKAFLRDQLDEYYHSPTQDGKIIPHLKRASKRRLINAILLDRWGVVIAEDIAERVDVLVDKEIKSSRRDIFFMLGGEGKVLREWSHKYQARIRINVESATITVQASQQNMEGLEESMADLLVGLVEEELDMSWVSRLGAFNQTFIPPIATITNTFIERLNGDCRKLRISGLRREAIQDARRLLFTSLDLQLRSSYSLLYSVPQDPGGDTGALFPISEGSSLPWRFRGTDWARWRSIRRKVNKQGAAERNPQATFQTIVRKVGEEDSPELRFGFKEVRQLLDMPVGEQSTVPDNASISTEYEAVLGYLLHDSSNSEALSKPQGLRDFIKDERLRVLCNDFPGLTSLTQNLTPITDSGDSAEGAQSLLTQNLAPIADSGDSAKDAQSSLTQNLTPIADSGDAPEDAPEDAQNPPSGPKSTPPYQSCILKFLPSPWSLPDTFEQYPPLELKMNLNQESGEPQPFAMTAVHSDTTADILFPNASCDVRFRRRTTVPLDLPTNTTAQTAGGGGGGGGVSERELERFLNESSLNPLLHAEIRASPHISVSLPNWMILHPKPTLPPIPPEEGQGQGQEQDTDKSTEIIQQATGKKEKGRQKPKKVTEEATEEEEEKVTKDVDYIFAGLEYRREVNFLWKGITLKQTLVQGGVTGGRKTETKLVWEPRQQQCGDDDAEDGDGTGVVEQRDGDGDGDGDGEEVKRVPFATFAEKTAELVDVLGTYIASKAWRIGGKGW